MTQVTIDLTDEQVKKLNELTPEQLKAAGVSGGAEAVAGGILIGLGVDLAISIIKNGGPMGSELCGDNFSTPYA
jgi:hypothetical protein